VKFSPDVKSYIPFGQGKCIIMIIIISIYIFIIAHSERAHWRAGISGLGMCYLDDESRGMTKWVFKVVNNRNELITLHSITN